MGAKDGLQFIRGERTVRGRVFIGSSSEGREVASALQSEIYRHAREATVWDQDVFNPSGYVLPTLVTKSQEFDFAVLVASPDELAISRGKELLAPRGNVMVEFGLFVGALGLERTFILPTSQGLNRRPTSLV